MNAKYYSNKYASNYNDSDDSDDDDDDYENYMNEIDDNSDYGYGKGNKKSNLYGGNNYGSTVSTFGDGAGLSKYDVNNPSYRMSSVNLANDKAGSKFTNVAENKKNQKKSTTYDAKTSAGYGSGGLGSYGGYNLGGYGISNQYNLGTSKDNYNIDIDLSKIKKENEPLSSNLMAIKKDKKPDITTKSDQENNKIIPTSIAPKKKKRDFLDDLDDQLEKEKKKEQEALLDDSIQSYNSIEKENKYSYIDYDVDQFIDIKDKKIKDQTISKSSNDFENEVEEKIEEKDSINDITNKDESNDIKDSTISIGKYMQGNKNQENETKKEKSDEEEYDHEDNEFSYNKITGSKDILESKQEDIKAYDINKMEEYLRNTGALFVENVPVENNKSVLKNTKINSKKNDYSYSESSNLNHQPNLKAEQNTINSVEDKYNDFEDNSKLMGLNSENDPEDVYDKFDADVASNLAESINDNPLLNLAKSSASGELKNLIIGSNSDILFNKDKEDYLKRKNLPEEKFDKNEFSSSSEKIDKSLKSGIIEKSAVSDKKFGFRNEKTEKIEKEHKSVNMHNNYDNKTNIQTNLLTTVNFASPTNSVINKTPNDKNYELNYNHEYIQNIIAEEFKKMTKNLNLSSSFDNMKFQAFSSNPTNLNSANQEIQSRLKSYLIDKSENFLIYSDSHSHSNRKEIEKKKFIIYRNDELFISRTFLTKKDIKELKLQAALDEERKRREYYEINHNRLKEINEEFENKLKLMKRIELESSELLKKNYETEHKYKELEGDFLSLKNDYDIKLKLVEERIVNRESKNESRKIAEMQRKFEIEIENLKNELLEKNSELLEFKNKSEYLEKENTKLSINKISNLEINEKIKELRNENFIMHEKYLEMTTKFERLYAEKEKIERKLLEKAVHDDEEEDKIKVTFNDKIKLNSNLDKNVAHNKLMTNELYSNVSNVNTNPDKFSIFDQILLEREQNVQESIIKSYSKEIEKLNNEIKLLKNLVSNGGDKKIPRGIKKKDSFGIGITNDQLNSNEKNKQFNNYINNDLDNFVKDSAEEKIKILNKFFIDNNSYFKNLENEFSLYEKFISSQSDSSSGEIDIDSYLKIFLNKLSVPLTKYELIEIFNNFPRTKDNKIRYSELLNAIISKDPSNFFLQPDPSYLKEIEKKFIFSDSKIKELEKNLEGYKLIEINLKNKISSLETEVNSLNSKIIFYQEKELGNDNLIGSLIKNNFVNNTGPSNLKNLNSIKEDPTIKKLKEKIKSLEIANVNNISDFEKKINQYEEKFNNIKKNFESGGDNKNSEILSLNKEIKLQIEENLSLKSKLLENEMLLKNEISKNIEKLNKYKKNYGNLKERLEKSEKDKEKIISSIQGKNKNLDINPSLIQNFIINTEEMEIMSRKLDELEKKNKEREEYYRQLCYNSNTYQVNKELDALNKKFDLERKELMKIINQKNNDIMAIKKEFEDIYRELEEIKFSKKK